MGFSTLKLDMSKVYDRVNGLFIKKIFVEIEILSCVG